MTDEERQRDYPYYRGVPVALSDRQWLIALAGVALATWILLGQFEFFRRSFLLHAAPAVLLAVIPLGALALAAGKHWTALFRKVRLRDVGWMFGFALLNYIVAIASGFAALKLIDVSRNPGITGMAASGHADQILFFAASIPQLIGEELITIIPFLAIIYFLTQKLAMSRNVAVIVAWLVTAVWFGAIHLPTYDFHLIQSLLLIGTARLVLTLAYIKTKNLWVSAGAHIINDWTTFILALFTASTGAAG
jgi:membrane protease YdiL (CAAX protease family)